MIRAGLEITSRRRRLVVALYLVQLFVSLLFAVAVEHVLAATFAHRPLFANGVAGDTEALLLSLGARLPLTSALAVSGLALGLGYFVLSLFLIAGLVGAFSGRSFGDAAVRWFPAYLRLWLWSLIPYAIGAIVAALGWDFGSGLLFERIASVKLLIVRPLACAAPGLLLVAVTMCAVDYARVELQASGGRGALSALVRGFRIVFGRPAALVHYGLFLLFWAAVSALYVAATFGHPFAGPAGAVTLFALRQLVAIVRFTARVVTTGGQVALVLSVHGR
jgi:hypothetical protein